jgi:glycosyltransferase involved in cell wall biosynthesis/GT2 family glycosyltransferase
MNTKVAINGRFLTQRVTGVQRYARSIIAEMDRLSDASSPVVLTPPGADISFLRAMEVRANGPVGGHAWEQFVLPAISRGQRLLNLCNTAPVAKMDQIVCIHDANIFTAPQSYRSSFRMMYGALQPALAARSARITTVSHAAARQLARYLPLDTGAIAVLPNGHEHALNWNPCNSTIATRLWPDPTSRRSYVLALGSNARHKNLALLTSIAAELDDLDLDIVVVGESHAVFNSQVLSITPNVRMAGRASDDDLAYLLEGAVCLAFPSLTEGFGLPIVEAMARRCPVVSSNAASMPEVCGSAAVLVSPTDRTAWVAAIRQLLVSSQMRDDLIERASEHVKEFSWQATAAGYQELLDQPKAALRNRRTATDLGRTRVTVVFATRGRPEVVTAVVRHLLAHQTLKPEAVIVSCSDVADAGELVNEQRVTVVTGPPGLAAQRNTALSHVAEGTEIVVFFDDDFVAGDEWLSSAVQIFRDESQVIGLTGNVIADGIKGPGISFADALDLLRQSKSESTWRQPYSPYGCNMAFRCSAIGDTRFDERLVLYGWLEDRDFGAALAKNGGQLSKSSTLIGVHMGVKSGRISGHRLGYSQVINPIYMAGKGTMTVSQVAAQVFRNLSSNLGRAAFPEAFVDRKGRLIGNLVGLIHAVSGVIEPERAAAVGFAKISVPKLRDHGEVV